MYGIQRRRPLLQSQRELLARVSRSRPPQRGARLVAFDVGVLRRDARVEEALEGGADRCTRANGAPPRGHVHERVTVSEHASRPLLVLAHRQVVAERERSSSGARDRGVDVREERRLEGQRLVGPRRWTRGSGRRGSRGRSARAVGASRCGSWRPYAPATSRRRARGGREPGEPAVVVGNGVLRGEDDEVAARELDAEVARASVAELLGRDLVDDRSAPRAPLGAAVGRPGVDDDYLDLLVDLLGGDPARQRSRSRPPSFTGMTTEITRGCCEEELVREERGAEGRDRVRDALDGRCADERDRRGVVELDDAVPGAVTVSTSVFRVKRCVWVRSRIAALRVPPPPAEQRKAHRPVGDVRRGQDEASAGAQQRTDRASAVPGSRRCSTTSPHSTTSNDPGSNGSSSDSTSPTSDLLADRARLNRGGGIELHADNGGTRLDEWPREVAGRAADVEHAAGAVCEREREQAGVAALRPVVERHVAAHGRERSTTVARDGSPVRIVSRPTKKEPSITWVPTATSVKPIAVAYSCESAPKPSSAQAAKIDAASRCRPGAGSRRARGRARA